METKNECFGKVWYLLIKIRQSKKYKRFAIKNHEHCRDACFERLEIIDGE